MNLPLAKFNMVPERDFSKDLRSCLLAAMPENFFSRVESRSILLKKSPSFSFYNDGILIDGENNPIETDIVILATGFRSIQKLKNIFTSHDFHEFIAVSPDSRVSLYRLVITHDKIFSPYIFKINYMLTVSFYASENAFSQEYHS